MADLGGQSGSHEIPAQKATLLLFPLLALLLALRFFLLPRSSSKQQSIHGSSSSSKELPLPPSPPGLPIIGHLHLVGDRPHVSLRDLAARHAGGGEDGGGGGLMLLRLGAVRNVVVSSAGAAEAAMRAQDHAMASRPRSAVVEALLQGAMDVAFAPYGERWRQSRKLVTAHLLTFKKVKSFTHARHDEVRQAIAKIREAAATGAGAAVNMSDVLYSFANDVVCRAVSGKFFRAEGRDRLFRELIEMNTALIDGFNVGDYFPGLARFDLLTKGVCGKANKLGQRWHELLDKLIDDHASKASSMMMPTSTVEEEQNKQREEGDFIDVLLSLQHEYGLDRNHMKAILMDMFAAGTDTSYIVMEFAIAELIQNPNIMAKLQYEVRTNVPKSQDMVLEENLGDMTYLKAVVKETLRLHPPVPLLLPRQSMTDCDINGYRIPAQTRVIINAWAISRDPKIWDKAEEFVPERFITGSTKSIDFKGNDFQFTPFGAGRRICPGLNFGLASVEIMLANLIYHFNWELPNGMAKEDIDMTDVFGLTMRRKEKLFLVPRPYDTRHALQDQN
ncbi:hypothetical protein ACP4OV_018467 [Aristida adscensionis]